MDTPAADIAVDEPLVRRLLRSQHPDLADLPLVLVASGWDNVLYRLGDDLVVRLPRRLVAAELVVHEQRWLPGIAERVSVAVPSPVRVGTPQPEFPFPWTIARWLVGDLASETDGAGFATDLARFVRELHTAAPADAPVNPVRGVPLRSRDAALRSRLESGAVTRAAELGRLLGPGARCPRVAWAPAVASWRPASRERAAARRHPGRGARLRGRVWWRPGD